MSIYFSELPIWLYVVGSFSFFFLMAYSVRYLNQRWNKRQQEIKEVYSPGYGILLSKRSRKISDEDFRNLFRDLLISKRHMVNNPVIRMEMKEWLRNNRDPEGYRLQMLFEFELSKYEHSLLQTLIFQRVKLPSE